MKYKLLGRGKCAHPPPEEFQIMQGQAQEPPDRYISARETKRLSKGALYKLLSDAMLAPLQALFH